MKTAYTAGCLLTASSGSPVAGPRVRCSSWHFPVCQLPGLLPSRLHSRQEGGGRSRAAQESPFISNEQLSRVLSQTSSVSLTQSVHEVISSWRGG